MKRTSIAIAASLLLAATIGLTGCASQQDGPAKDTGEHSGNDSNRAACQRRPGSREGDGSALGRRPRCRREAEGLPGHRQAARIDGQADQGHRQGPRRLPVLRRLSRNDRRRPGQVPRQAEITIRSRAGQNGRPASLNSGHSTLNSAHDRENSLHGVSRIGFSSAF